MSIPFIKTLDFEYVVPAQLSPLIRRVVCKNPGPFTFFGTGTYIIGNGNVAVIDPGPLDQPHLEAILSATKGEQITHIFVTHPHNDHSPLARELSAKTGAKIYGISERATHKQIGNSAEEGDDTNFVPDIEICDGEIFTLDGFTLKAITTPGHIDCHVCFALLDENALFSGDHIMGWSTSVIIPPDGNMSDYLNSLDKVAAMNFATLYPTHGAPISDPAPFIAAYKAHRLEREAQVLDCLSNGISKISDMVPLLYAATDKRLWAAAARSLHAHLIRLVENGIAKSENKDEINSVFRL